MDTSTESGPAVRLGSFLGVLLLAAGAAGCMSPKDYFRDRWNDAKDIFTVEARLGLGAKARVGPVHAGLIASNAGPHGGDEEFELLVVPFPSGYEEGDWVFGIDEHQEFDDRKKDYLALGDVPFVTTRLKDDRSPAYFTQIEVEGGALLCVRLGFNPGELLDFLLGWFGVDIYGDDKWANVGKKSEQEEKERAEAEPERKFHLFMLYVCDQIAGQCRYRPSRTLQMTLDLGGVAAAKRLINAPRPSSDFAALKEYGRLDLTAECCALLPEFRPLFTADELARARKRLLDHGYAGPEVRER